MMTLTIGFELYYFLNMKIENIYWYLITYIAPKTVMIFSKIIYLWHDALFLLYWDIKPLIKLKN